MKIILLKEDSSESFLVNDEVAAEEKIIQGTFAGGSFQLVDHIDFFVP